MPFNQNLPTQLKFIDNIDNITHNPIDIDQILLDDIVRTLNEIWNNFAYL